MKPSKINFQEALNLLEKWLETGAGESHDLLTNQTDAFLRAAHKKEKREVRT